MKTKYMNLSIFSVLFFIFCNRKPPKSPFLFILNFTFWQSLPHLIYNYNSGVCLCVRRRFRVLIDWRNQPGQSDFETGNWPGQSDFETGNWPGQSDSAN